MHSATGNKCIDLRTANYDWQLGKRWNKLMQITIAPLIDFAVLFTYPPDGALAGALIKFALLLNLLTFSQLTR